MQYREFGRTGLKLSVLGFGTMRLPIHEDESIHEEEAIRILRRAIDAGVNYVDTAYPYHKGDSETLVGKALRDGYREKTYLATKCPVWMLKEEADFEKYLEEQLVKLQTDHIDFYLLHALDRGRFEEKVKKLHLISHLEKAREAGKIKYIGFSFHDFYELFEEIIGYYDGWDFCQIQYNYIDLEHQAGDRGLHFAADRGLGVIVMEPLLGGKLANLEPHVRQAFTEQKTPVEHSLDFLWNQPEVGLLLSGMSDEKQVEDNLLYADRSRVGMLSSEDLQMYRKAKEIYDRMALVNCTGCGYCMPCPFGLSIPDIFRAYNMTSSRGEEEARAAYEAVEVRADACQSCGHCESECPQHIKVIETMDRVSSLFKQ